MISRLKVFVARQLAQPPWLVLASVAALAVPLWVVARPRVLGITLVEEAAFLAPGLLIIRAAAGRRAGWLPVVAFGPIVGFGLSSLALLGLWLAGARGSWTLFAAPALVSILVPLARRVPDRWPFPETQKADRSALAAALLVVPLVVTAPFANVGADVSDGKAYRAYFTADYVWRRTVVAELAKGDVLPANPFHVEDPLHYYWLPHLATAVTYRNTPADLDELLLVHSVMADIAFVAFLFGLARWFVPVPGAAAMGVVSVIFCSSYEGLFALWELWRYDAPLSLVRYLNIDAMSRWRLQGMPIDGLQRVLFYQPHHAMGYALGTLGLLAVTGRRRRFDPMAMAVGGTLLGMSTLVSSFAGLMFTTVAALWEAVSVLRWREWWRASAHVAAASLPLVLAAAIVTALHYVDHGGPIIAFGLNPVAAHNVWAATFLSFGPVLLSSAMATWVFWRLGDGRGWLFAALWFVCAMFYFFVDIRDHQDVYVGWRVGHLWFIASAALGATVYRWLSNARPRVRWTGTAVLAVTLLAAVPTTLIDIYNTQDISNRNEGPGFPWTLVLSPAEQEAFSWIKANTQADAVFQLDAAARGSATWAYLPAFAERRLGVGLPISMVPLQKYQEGSRAASWMFETPDVVSAHAMATRNGIQYLFVGAPERQHHPAVNERFEAATDWFELVFRNGAASIYRVR